ncbi:hypothetical protein KBC75_05645 [Candidatus Shapirobacteria bacterium]|nr:hypothetical protein [Candidatus Shapirobacteria bacterium]
MIKKVLLCLFILFNLLFGYYLWLPVPVPPDLPNSAKSNLPGDTVQLKNVSAYYTNLSRAEVVNFYKANYGGYLRIILNHPPERSKEVIRDTTQSYYLQEFILPFKESLFINGYEWASDVFTKPEKRQQNKLIFEEKEYKAKITLKTFPVTLLNRYLTFFSTELGIIFIIFIYRQLYKKHG